MAPEAISPEHVPDAIASRDSDESVFLCRGAAGGSEGRPGARSCARFARLGKKRRPTGAPQKSRGLCADTGARRSAAGLRGAASGPERRGLLQKAAARGMSPAGPSAALIAAARAPERACRRLVAPRLRPAPRSSPTPSARLRIAACAVRGRTAAGRDPRAAALSARRLAGAGGRRARAGPPPNG